MAVNAPRPKTTTTRPVTPSASADSTTDGPVLNVINKRLRALRKKNNRIIQMEESVAQGKVLNKEQEETLRSKTVILAQIEELEKLKQPLAAAVAEEHDAAVKKYLEKEKEARVSEEEGYAVVEEVKHQKEDESVNGVVENVLSLVYFGSIFDVHSEFSSMMLTKTLERGCCLTYDYVTDEAVDVLGEKDLDFISQLSSFLTSRPRDSSLSHKDALERCVEHAKLWLAKSEQPIGPDTSITYSGLRERLNKIMTSEYFTATPEMKAPVDVAAAAALKHGAFQAPVPDALNYGSYQAPVQEHYVTGHAEGNVIQYKQQDAVLHYQQENGDHEFSNAEEEGHKEGVARDHCEVASQQDHDYTQPEEQNQRDSDQYVQRRGYQNQRGGRRGFNDRGFRGGSRRGGPYQNGRNQYYDQPGKYYTRYNYNGRGRGGRGAGGQGYNQYGVNPHSGDIGRSILTMIFQLNVFCTFFFSPNGCYIRCI